MSGHRPAALAVAVAAVALAGCGGGTPNGAARLVPADAIIYLHVSTDSGRAATRRASALLRRFPHLAAEWRALPGQLARPGGGVGVSYSRDIAPWIGKEATLAFARAGQGNATSELVVDVHDPPGARQFLQRLGSQGATETYRGVLIHSYVGGSYAFVSHYLVEGSDAIVHAAIDLHDGRGRSLASDGAYSSATSGAPSDRVLDAYVSGVGVRRSLRVLPGLLGAAGALLDRPGLRGVDISLSAEARTARVRIHSAIAGAPPATAFEPTLAGAIRAPALAFLEETRLDRELPRLEAVANAVVPGAGIAQILQRTGAALSGAGVNLRTGLAPLVAGETAVALTPGAPVPVLTLVARTADEPRARTILASLQAPLVRLLTPASAATGQIPTFTPRTVAGATAYQLRITPGLELDYAVLKGEIVISTSLRGIAAAAGGKGSLAAEPAYRAATTDAPRSVTSLVFLDPSQLLELGEQAGLGQDPRFQAVRDDLGKVRAVGLSSSSGENDTTAELTLQIP